MPTKPQKAWYGVRTPYRVTAEGEPKSRGRLFDSQATLIEDRVVLFQADGFDDALAQAAKEARAYCRQVKFNSACGQSVRMRLPNLCDAYEIMEMTDGPPTAGWEVYSSAGTVSDSVQVPGSPHRAKGPCCRGPRRQPEKALSHAQPGRQPRPGLRLDRDFNIAPQQKQQPHQALD